MESSTTNVPTLKSLDSSNGAKPAQDDKAACADEADEKLKEAAKKFADQADKWEAVAKDTAADAAEKLAGTADRLADVAKDTLASATTAFAGFADKLLDALTGKPEKTEGAKEEPVQGSENPEVENRAHRFFQRGDRAVI